MKVCKVGDGLAVLLPANVAERLGLNEGDEVTISRVELPRPRTKAEIDAMFDRLRKFSGRLPADYKFDREEANSRDRDD